MAKDVDEEESVEIKPGEFVINAISAAFEHLVKEDEFREKQAEALLGGCLDLVCTYPEGYKARQPLYSCKTCSAESGDQLAGVCYGCSENCHEGHDLVELYTKRSFCCDCGNSKFAKRCKLFEEKDPLNSRNRYNENFQGIFCSCKKPYPPPMDESGNCSGGEAAMEDMIQCPLCEDWFHPSHAISNPEERSKLDRERDEQFDLICALCIQKHSWLLKYAQLEEKQQQMGSEKPAVEQPAPNECKLAVPDETGKEKTVERQPKEGDGICLALGWREQLCRCGKCMALYEDTDCTFLLDPEDTLEFYEKQNREKQGDNPAQPEDQCLQRDLAIHVTSEIDEMKRHCMDFFAKRSAQKRSAAITKEDVEECFQELREKRQRMLSDQEEEEKEAAWTQ